MYMMLFCYFLSFAFCRTFVLCASFVLIFLVFLFNNLIFDIFLIFVALLLILLLRTIIIFLIKSRKLNLPLHSTTLNTHTNPLNPSPILLNALHCLPHRIL